MGRVADLETTVPPANITRACIAAEHRLRAGLGSRHAHSSFCRRGIAMTESDGPAAPRRRSQPPGGQFLPLLLFDGGRAGRAWLSWQNIQLIVGPGLARPK